ncbi:hypothetical protein J6590_090430 [Homalodisca vitripennis]|nr:hypothetical protein J6590_086680 [Homalodisca vitripennis]KAG8324517.1 hypothetical protein J6590_090430 [Homalodisca vitripennis]
MTNHRSYQLQLPTLKDRTNKLISWLQVPIQKAKLNDIIKLTNYTAGYEDFYNALQQWPTTDAEMIEGFNENDE